ncbi:hypothetical protein Ahy_B02g060715 [Arachis hypogaea]|uniref:Transposase MuDR plant domain-containing protein n=1 Tax=Arachis hypogaea TaxID=3818 RepID=A0A445AJ84_ARAHY|nr:hypothetical protein Ahy_B02g060715 [Arachis hypogaea]
MQQPQIELYIEFKNIEANEIQNDLDIEDDRAAVYEGMNSDSEEDFEATYEAGDEDEDGDVGVEAAVENVSVHPAVSVADPEEGELRIRMEYSSRKSVVAAIRSYTISRGVDYNVYESKPQTFYAKCNTYGRGCDWLIRASLIWKKGCWEIQRYNGRHTCTVGTISQDHSKLDSDTVAEAIRPLVETNPSIKVKSIIVEVQSRFNYTVSYRKAGLAKQKSVAKVFGVVNRFVGDWQPPKAWWIFCIRHIGSNFLRAFKVPHLKKLVVNIGYSRTVEEYNINYKRLEERDEAYTQWCDAIGLRHWVLAFDEGHRWGYMTTNLVEYINLVLKGVQNFLVLALVRATYYRLNELFTRKSAETHERKRVTVDTFRWNDYHVDMLLLAVPTSDSIGSRDAETWPAYQGPTLVANPALRYTSKGCPKLTRYLNEMDSRDMRSPRICRLCGA